MRRSDSPSACPVSHGAAGVDDPALFSTGDYRGTWAELRGRDSLAWQNVQGRSGFWSVVRYHDADRVLRDADTFTSERGTMLFTLGEQDPAGGRQIPVTDPPRHTALRARLQKALAIKSVEQQTELIRGLIREVIAPLGDGEFDFAQAMLVLPVAVGGTAMGLPRADWPRLTRLLTASIAPDDPDYRDPAGKQATLEAAHRELFGYFQDICYDRRRRPGDDLISVLITTEVNGRAMSAGEVLSNCYSVLLGASVTTPHSPNYVMAEHLGDGLLDRWAADPGATTLGVEEALRLASPVSYFMRYATRDVTVRNTPIKAGDAVVVWLGAANRDDEVFPDADRFLLHRKPNRHLAFGIGPHYCVGHTLARVTLRLLFDELLSGFTDFTPTGSPSRMHSTFISGYKHLPISAKPRGAA